MAGISVTLLYIILAYTNIITAVLNPGCKCVTYQRENGAFTSPGYPQPYRSGINCILYIFIAPPNSNQIIEITFTDFDVGNVAASSSCSQGDVLKLYLDKSKPSISKDARPNTQICGNISMLTSRSFYSSDRILIMELSSAYSSSSLHRGFSGKFNFIDRSIFSHDGVVIQGSRCGYQVLSASTKKGKIFSPGYPQNYRNDMRCWWLLSGDWDEKVQVTFLKIDLATTGIANQVTCNPTDKNNDLITIHDGDNETAPVIASFCGRHDHEEVVSTGMKMYILFMSNSHTNMQGFYAIFNFFKPKPKAAIHSCDRNVTSEWLKTGVISSENYPEFYNGGTVCTYTFQGKDFERVVISFDDFDLGDENKLERQPNCNLQDQLTVSIKVNNTYMRTLQVLCGTSIPPSMMSNNGFLQLKFEAQSHKPRSRGFNLTYKFVSDFGIKSDERFEMKDSTCNNKYLSTVRLTGEIVSPNFPGLYPHDTTCTYYFYGSGKRVKINFLDFDVRGEPPACLEEQHSDYVAFSNFYTADDKQMSRFYDIEHTNMTVLVIFSSLSIRYCGNDDLGFSPLILNKPVISDGDFFRIVFKSALTYSGKGFRAVYTFIDKPESESDGHMGLTDNKNNKGLTLTFSYLLISYNILLFSLLLLFVNPIF